MKAHTGQPAVGRESSRQNMNFLHPPLTGLGFFDSVLTTHRFQLGPDRDLPPRGRGLRAGDRRFATDPETLVRHAVCWRVSGRRAAVPSFVLTSGRDESTPRPGITCADARAVSGAPGRHRRRILLLATTAIAFDWSHGAHACKGSLARSAAEPPLTPSARRAGRAHLGDGRRGRGSHPKHSCKRHGIFETLKPPAVRGVAYRPRSRQ